MEDPDIELDRRFDEAIDKLQQRADNLDAMDLKVTIAMREAEKSGDSDSQRTQFAKVQLIKEHREEAKEILVQARDIYYSEDVTLQEKEDMIGVVNNLLLDYS